jgi:hypothetical protein
MNVCDLPIAEGSKLKDVLYFRGNPKSIYFLDRIRFRFLDIALSEKRAFKKSGRI